MEWQWQDHDYADGWCGGEEVTKWIDYGSCQCSLLCSHMVVATSSFEAALCDTMCPECRCLTAGKETLSVL